MFFFIVVVVIFVIMMCQCNGSWIDEFWVQVKLWVCGVVQIIVDVIGELVIFCYLCWGLDVSILICGVGVVDDVWFDCFQIFDEVGYIDYQIVFNWEVS